MKRREMAEFQEWTPGGKPAPPLAPYIPEMPLKACTCTGAKVDLFILFTENSWVAQTN